MGIALTIVAGLIVMTFVAAGFDFLTKRNKGNSNESLNKINELEKRIQILENNEQEKKKIISKLEDEIQFVNKLLEDKSNNQ